jgi:heme-degrading monooxygenase HmoA
MNKQWVQPRISRDFSGTTFIQLWRMQSAQAQQEWLGAMHKNIHLLQKEPGFGSMNLHASLDGRNVIVYAQWDSEAKLKAAVDLPEVKAARVELDSHGEPDGSLFKIDSVYQTGNAGDGVIAIELVPERMTFVNIWIVPGQEQQQELLAAMKEESAALVSKPGSRGMALHTSFDGTRIAVYAMWDSLETFEASVSHNATAQENRAKLARFGEPNANNYRLDSVNLPLG